MDNRTNDNICNILNCSCSTIFFNSNLIFIFDLFIESLIVCFGIIHVERWTDREQGSTNARRLRILERLRRSAVFERHQSA